MNNQITVINTDSGEIKLSHQIVKGQLLVGDNVTARELNNFIALCKFKKLNPFIGEAYIVKFGNDCQIITSKDVFTKRLNKNPKYQGQETGVIVENNKTGELIERKGTFYKKKNETLVGAYTKIFIKDWKIPFNWTINLDEYIRFNKKGQIQSNWKKMPAIMLTKCCLVAAIRNAFPEDYSGLYTDDELGIDNAINVDYSIIDDENKKTKKTPILADNPTLIKQINEAAKSEKVKYDTDKLIKYVLTQLKGHGKISTDILEHVEISSFDIVLESIKKIVAKKESEEEKKKEKEKEVKYELKDTEKKKTENKESENENDKENKNDKITKESKKGSEIKNDTSKSLQTKTKK